MTKANQIYKCEICGNIIEVLHPGAGELICCGQPMKAQTENTADAAKEGHIPIIAEMPANVCRGKDGIKVSVGEKEHPMDAEHYIEWIEIITADGKRGKKFLNPGDKPVVEFYTRMEIVGAKAYCNLHGLWKSK